MTISNFKEKMADKAERKGNIWENFGQKELSKLKEKYGYNLYGNEEERKTAEEIDKLDKWAMSYRFPPLTL